jgi:DNA-directed RNA polymerase subunit M/transcription elongation factor TFIIS
MMTVDLKACERCGGDMSYESDIYGQFRQCLQCSYLEDLPPEAAAEAAKKREQAPESVAEAVKKDSRAKEGSDVG